MGVVHQHAWIAGLRHLILLLNVAQLQGRRASLLHELRLRVHRESRLVLPLATSHRHVRLLLLLLGRQLLLLLRGERHHVVA